MDKRFQVFVSSTFKDLEIERQEVMHALLELDCMPSGMELFPATNDTQWNLIKKVIDDSDYYILIMGGRYGSISPEGISYTEMEYRYALSINKPTISFIHRDPGKIIADKTESTPEGREKLNLFRIEVEKKLCKHWETPDELGSVVSRSLIQLIKSQPAVGWVRADLIAGPDATLELLKLRKQIDLLETELGKLKTSAPAGSESLSQGSAEFEITYTYRATNNKTYAYTTYKDEIPLSWDLIFASVAPSMIHEASDQQLRNFLNTTLEKQAKPHLRDDHPGNKLSMFNVDLDDFQTIKIQLRALGLIKKNDKPRSVKDSDTYWTLTPYGDEVMTRLRAIQTSQL